MASRENKKFIFDSAAGLAFLSFKGAVLAATFLFAAVLFLPVQPARAESFVSINRLDYPLAENYNQTSPSGEVVLTVAAGATKKPLTAKILDLVSQDNISAFFAYPEGLAPKSDLYSVRFTPVDESAAADSAAVAAGDNFSAQPTITLKYQADDQYQEVYYYNWTNLAFEKLTSQRDTINHTLTFVLPAKKSVSFALFGEPSISGLASWYTHPKYPYDLIAASRDFAVGTQVKVVGVNTGKEVIVTIKDYGPKTCDTWTEKEIIQMGPCQDRVLDLSKNAFLKLAPLGAGVINVKVQAL